MGKCMMKKLSSTNQSEIDEIDTKLDELIAYMSSDSYMALTYTEKLIKYEDWHRLYDARDVLILARYTTTLKQGNI